MAKPIQGSKNAVKTKDHGAVVPAKEPVIVIPKKKDEPAPARSLKPDVVLDAKKKPSSKKQPESSDEERGKVYSDELSDESHEEAQDEIDESAHEIDGDETLNDSDSLPVAYESQSPALLDKEPDEESDYPAVVKGTLKGATDPLKRYMQEIKNAPHLTSDEEQNLVKRMHEAGDVQAAKLLVSANLKLVVRIAYEYRSMYHNLLDLIQEGNVGLMKAVSKFDPTKGARLGYYATWWIRSYILKYLLDNFRLVRVGTSAAQKKLFYHLVREKQRLEAQGIHAGPALLAQNLDVKEKDVIEMEQRLLGPGAEMSLDAQTNEDDPRSNLLSSLFDAREGADLSLERDEWLGILKKELPIFRKSLNDKEKMILDARILMEEPKTLQEVANEFGLTRERVRQIEVRVIEKLRKQLENYLK